MAVIIPFRKLLYAAESRPGELQPQAWWSDARLYQIAVLALLLLYGVVWLDFALTYATILVLLATILLTQAACAALWRLPAYDPRSALISGLSLCLLLRTNVLALTVLAAVLSIASKFVLRWRGKHVFNPTNFGLVVMLLVSDQVWVSAGQWGSTTVLAFFIVCLGSVVINRAERSDVTYAFLGFYVALQVGRALWLGDPLAIPWHRLQNGALLLFTFFMISDPKTTPDSRAGRILFAGLVVLAAGYVQFVLYRTNALLWALACSAFAVPLLDVLLPGKRYTWSRPAPVARLAGQGESHAVTVDRSAAGHPMVHAGRPGFLRFLRRQSRYPFVQ
jgi:Na+-transporting NADH:ubiquinone oxidoreductase subunit NqrB